MSYAKLEKDADGKWFVGPDHLGLSKIRFKDDSYHDLVIWVQAMNQAHTRGREELAYELRLLLGAAKDEGV